MAAEPRIQQRSERCWREIRPAGESGRINEDGCPLTHQPGGRCRRRGLRWTCQARASIERAMRNSIPVSSCPAARRRDRWMVVVGVDCVVPLCTVSGYPPVGTSLITSGTRGDGGILRNHAGEAFSGEIRSAQRKKTISAAQASIMLDKWRVHQPVFSDCHIPAEENCGALNIYAEMHASIDITRRMIPVTRSAAQLRQRKTR